MQKIAILGGGIGALATAVEITNDPRRQENYDITIYQMGWRLRGKGASGRSRNIFDRIQEHGIHLWMGFYENVFQMIRQAYAEAHEKSDVGVAVHRRAQGFLTHDFHPDDGAGWGRLEILESELACQR
jgi:uncharacterized protein with NAD-binding domain and iron-sulfur cluster